MLTIEKLCLSKMCSMPFYLSFAVPVGNLLNNETKSVYETCVTFTKKRERCRQCEVESPFCALNRALTLKHPSL